MTSLALMIPSRGTKCFESTDFAFYVVGFEVEVHPLFADFGVLGELEKHAYLGVREAEPAVDLPARRIDRFFSGIEGGGPEGDALVEVADVDDEVGYPAGVWAHGLPVSTRS